MKKGLLLFFSCITILCFSQVPDFSITSFQTSTKDDTLVTNFTVRTDSSGLPFSVGVFLSEDDVLDESDQLVLFTGGNSTANVNMNFIGNINFGGPITTLDQYAIGVVTHNFDTNTPLTVSAILSNGLAPDANFLDNISQEVYNFPANIVQGHNDTIGGPGPVDTTNLDVNSASSLVYISNHDYVSLESCCGVQGDAISGFTLGVIKEFELVNALPVGLDDVEIKTYLSKEKGEKDKLIDTQTLSINRDDSVIFSINTDVSLGNTGNFEDSTNVFSVGNKMEFVLELRFPLGDSINVLKTINYGKGQFMVLTVGLEKETELRNAFISNDLTHATLHTEISGDLRVIDINGHIVLEQTVETPSSIELTTSLDAGTYIVLFDTKEGLLKRKVLLER